MANSTINPYRFAGQLGYRRDGTNRNYVRARHLNTEKARWLSRDPIPLDAAGFNFYWYVKNDPVNVVDPVGKHPQYSGNQLLYIGIQGSGDKCPGKDAYDLILKTVARNPACARAIKKTCPNGISSIIHSIQFVVKNHCIPQAPNDPCSTTSSPVNHKCRPDYICFNRHTCHMPVGERADLMLFEMINWCNCKYKNANPFDPTFEYPADNVEAVCLIPGSGPVRTGGGGTFPLKG